MTRSIMSGNQQGILIVVTVKRWQVLKALTWRTGLAKSVLIAMTDGLAADYICKRWYRK